MKTRHLIRNAAASMLLISVILILTISVESQVFAKESIDSKGNIVMDNGDMAFRASSTCR